jgi:hypothetical protein
VWRPILRREDLPPPGTRESEYLDFKREPSDQSEKGCIEIAQDVAQFANSLGGTILFGADEQESTLAGYVGIEDVDGVEERVRSVVKDRVEPVPRVETSRFPTTAPLAVLAVNVSPQLSVAGVRVTRERWAFPVRAGDQRRFLSFFEVEQMISPERRGRLMLEEIPKDRRHDVRLDAILESLDERCWTLDSLSDHHFVLVSQRSDVQVHIPLAFVEAVWPNDRFGQWTITLNARLVWRQGQGPGAGSIDVYKARSRT